MNRLDSGTAWGGLGPDGLLVLVSLMVGITVLTCLVAIRSRCGPVVRCPGPAVLSAGFVLGLIGRLVLGIWPVILLLNTVIHLLIGRTP